MPGKVEKWHGAEVKKNVNHKNQNPTAAKQGSKKTYYTYVKAILGQYCYIVKQFLYVGGFASC